ncbi:MAG: bifunctional DNA-formamidopyrimidine glycosylase/DNA-(apurinic or apyrimidinic site) lyase [Gemmatimonadetes bacterium]|uniref:Formamidopyrimidine-DNA glycosylase n=1 Tax=Candidatus Kutchimonas denitrificans TaxID=3056748 RepID=A0AAE5CCF8_9BACT|nr:bifunctional DNA-formamidopyrimidine glycosylase/DNA-(apurinic or apyrimidinic site) lyase [Gemmatimonadota bacterium]NIR75600.1 bifunctional DNA-formamidopyrimidine glycosylase/DNA-(apurinic or apyrimidinic site) lyase [Candidatus Kutchimonas denitrificans]NIS01914.1 bifunctional DNA-formamidopyrimidine glycosylase/DNA-(apurinic or apyrimidinic site) lyase [Gemmatimonadota bacterium]NIT67695.1 bifunctional DNA-formamidopyrimidine glycosylase/DNA-(apurinic or apyrimidinic site) lyase [Gemmati
MPELPEAETIARGLDAAVAGGRVARVRIHRAEVVEPLSAAVFRRAFTGRRIARIGRRGKWIVGLLDDSQRWVTQLRMTGRFTWRAAGPRQPLRAEPHLSVSLLIEPDGGEPGVLRFYDTRRFGRMRLLAPAVYAELDARLGVEPLSDAFTPARFARMLEGGRAPIRNWLLDQGRVAGVGNIYAVEACHIARLDPRRAAGDLDRNDVRRLHRAVRRVLSDAIARRGTTFSDYRDLLGGSGDFQNALRVYGREGEACPRGDGTIERAVLAGRSAFYCPACQR